MFFFLWFLAQYDVSCSSRLRLPGSDRLNPLKTRTKISHSPGQVFLSSICFFFNHCPPCYFIPSFVALLLFLIYTWLIHAIGQLDLLSSQLWKNFSSFGYIILSLISGLKNNPFQKAQHDSLTQSSYQVCVMCYFPLSSVEHVWLVHFSPSNMLETKFTFRH